MTNLSLDVTGQSAASFASLTPVNDVGSTPPTSQTNAVSLYPPATADTVRSAVGQYMNTPVILIKTKGDDAMQQVGPKEPGNSLPPGDLPEKAPVNGRDDGAIATAVSAAGQLLGAAFGPAGTMSTTAGEEVGGAIAQRLGGFVDTMFTPQGDIPAYIDPTTGEAITNQGGTITAGDPNADKGTYIGDVDDVYGPKVEGGYSADPARGGSSNPDSSFTYIDPTTGEPITNQGGTTTAGDPNADKGTYIGDVDDPNFNGDKGTSSSPDNSSSSTDSTPSSSTDSGSPQATETTPTDPAPVPDGDLPPDDASGTSSGPAGPRSDFMPADDSVGGVTPRSNAANVASLAAASASALQLIALSRTQIT